MLKDKANIAALIISIVYLIIASFLINDYGITHDEPQNFSVGHAYLHFYQSGDLNFESNIPTIENHPDFLKTATCPERIWPFANILSAITCSVFYQKLNLLNPISAHHIIIPIMTSIFLFIQFLFVKKHWGNLAGFLSILVLITYPRFFGHTFNNIKDVPEIILFSTSIFAFAEWIISKRVKFLYTGFVFFGLALATKIDAIFIPMILALWLVYGFFVWNIKSLKINIKIFFHFIAGSIISGITALIIYPSLTHDEPSYYYRERHNKN